MRSDGGAETARTRRLLRCDLRAVPAVLFPGSRRTVSSTRICRFTRPVCWFYRTMPLPQCSPSAGASTGDIRKHSFAFFRKCNVFFNYFSWDSIRLNCVYFLVMYTKTLCVIVYTDVQKILFGNSTRAPKRNCARKTVVPKLQGGWNDNKYVSSALHISWDVLRFVMRGGRGVPHILYAGSSWAARTLLFIYRLSYA